MDEYLERPQARLAYDVDGHGDRTPVVVAHSFLASRHLEDTLGIFDWRPVRADGHRLIRFDSRGHGESSGRAGEQDYRWPTLAGDLLAVLDAAEPTGSPVDAIGESTGAGTLLWAVVRAPERFRRLVLVIPPTIGTERHEQAQIYLAGASLIESGGRRPGHGWSTTSRPCRCSTRGAGPGRGACPSPSSCCPRCCAAPPRATCPRMRSSRPCSSRRWCWRGGRTPTIPTRPRRTSPTCSPTARSRSPSTPDDVRGWGERVARFLDED